MRKSVDRQHYAHDRCPRPQETRRAHAGDEAPPRWIGTPPPGERGRACGQHGKAASLTPIHPSQPVTDRHQFPDRSHTCRIPRSHGARSAAATSRPRRRSFPDLSTGRGAVVRARSRRRSACNSIRLISGSNQRSIEARSRLNGRLWISPASLNILLPRALVCLYVVTQDRKSVV